MIEINILPEELKSRARARKPAQTKEIMVKAGRQEKYFLYLIPFALGLVLSAHILLAALGIAKNAGLRSLTRKWDNLQSQRKVLDDFRRESFKSALDARLTQELTTDRITWAEKLNKLSLYLPAGVWLNDITIISSEFTLQGSVVSLEKEDLGLINKLIASLKSDAGFFKDFVSLQLASVQKKNIGGYDISDFILQGKLKQK